MTLSLERFFHRYFVLTSSFRKCHENQTSRNFVFIVKIRDKKAYYCLQVQGNNSLFCSPMKGSMLVYSPKGRYLAYFLNITRQEWKMFYCFFFKKGFVSETTEYCKVYNVLYSRELQSPRTNVIVHFLTEGCWKVWVLPNTKFQQYYFKDCSNMENFVWKLHLRLTGMNKSIQSFVKFLAILCECFETLFLPMWRF